MTFIDSHAHLDTFGDDLPEILQKMREANVRAVSIGTSSRDWPTIAQIAADNPEQAAYTVGIHPSEVTPDNPASEIAALEQTVGSTNAYCGIGEIGLDFYRLDQEANPTETVRAQRKVLDAQLDIIRNLSDKNPAVVIHSRGEGAFGEILAALDRSRLNLSRFVFHCFSEGPEQIRMLNERGARASFTGIITFKNGQLMRDALIAQDPSLLMIETDSPFLSPEPHRGQRNDPSHVPLVAQRAATLYGIPESELAALTTRNAIEFYGLTQWAQVATQA